MEFFDVLLHYLAGQMWWCDWLHRADFGQVLYGSDIFLQVAALRIWHPKNGIHRGRFLTRPLLLVAALNSVQGFLVVLR